MNDRIVLQQVRLTSAHKPTGRTRHIRVNEELPPPALLRIARYPDDRGCYLLYLDSEGEELTDTYHESLAAALAQAEWEFQVQPSQWQILVEQ